MFRFVQVFVLSSLLLLSACGGGSSSGGGSGATYAGTYSLTLSAGSAFASGSGTFTALVQEDTVTVTFDDGTIFTGKFTPAGVARSEDRSVVGVVEGCTSGTISLLIFRPRPEGTISALISAEALVCDGISFSLVGNLNGTLSQ